MSAIPYDSQPEEQTFALPGRRRRRFLNRKSAALAAAIACLAGFYAGVLVEKGQVGGATTTTASLPGTGAGARPGFLGGGRGGGAGGGNGNASFGTVSSVNGNTIYLTDSSGNTVKVTLSSAAKVTKSQSVSKSSVRPGDAVLIQGLKSSNGTVAATSVSDTGAGAARAGPGTTGSGQNNATRTGTAG